MKIREIMDCLFSVCTLGEKVEDVINKMQKKNSSYIIVIDKKNIYRGILTITSLIQSIDKNKDTIDSLVEVIETVSENEDISKLKVVNHEIIPVINDQKNVMGVINLKSVIEFLNERMTKYKDKYPGDIKSTPRLTSKYTIDNIIGESKDILLLKERIIAAAKTKSTVLILGETGTGKELVAHAITSLSSRRHQPFVRLNCAAIPETLLESELFGYEQGAFTGAIKGGNDGKFLMANNGTIFLDEIGDMQLNLQSKILRVLQEREIEKIGGQYPIPIDVRVIAATHEDLMELVRDNKFRRDLFYRLHVIPIQIPPIRNRREDIPLLVEHFNRIISKQLNITPPKIEESFINKILKYRWPGNVRELQNVVEMAVNFSNGIVNESHIPEYIIEDIEQTSHNELEGLRATTNETERDAILKALEKYNGNKIKVAKYLGISRSNLYYKIKKLEIDT
ncbi:MAG: sigma 54-interacting transcriptional regulator [Clostridia bacterium]|nr:sigma 54-interacting transcriptional regulator [Clostridia bacterium]